jgi:hypothetical protein
MVPAASETRTESRLAGLLGVLIFLGSLVLVGIPLGWLWLLSHMGQPYLTIYFLSLLGCPAAMVAWSLVLIRLNQVYLRLHGDPPESGAMLEASIVFAVVVGVLMLAAWLFLFPHGGGPVEGPWPG